jgi:hypothetical protein
MLGHKQIINLRKNFRKPTTVFIEIAPYPEVKYPYEDPENAILMNQSPTVYTGGISPKKADLSWVKGLKIQLLAMDASNEEFAKWWCAVVDAQPSFLIGVDADNEVNEWRA